MKFNYGTYILIILFFLSQNAWGQFRSFSCEGARSVMTAETGKVAMQKSQLASTRAKDFSGAFSQYSWISALDIQEISEGQVYFSAPGNMRWEYEKPEKQTFVLKGGTVWYYQNELEQMLIDNLKSLTLSDLPILFLSGMGDVTQDFKFESGCHNSEGVVLNLKPVESSETNALQRLRLLLKAGSWNLKGAEIVSQGGNTTSVLFNELVFNSGVDNSRFELSVPEGTDVQDRRDLFSRKDREK